MKKFLNWLNNILLIGLVVVAIIKLNPLIFLGALVPYFLKWIFKYRAKSEMVLFYYFFFICAYVLGVVFKMYHTTEWMDVFTHFLSGVFFTCVAFFLIKDTFLCTKKGHLLACIFLLSFSSLIAFIWEAGEFTYDTLFDKDTQFVKETGVGDTMEDMIAAEVGSFLVVFSFKVGITSHEKKTKQVIEYLL